MKTNRKLLALSLLAVLTGASSAIAGPSYPPNGFAPAKRAGQKLSPQPATHHSGHGLHAQPNCKERRAFYPAPSGRGLAWNTLRDCS